MQARIAAAFSVGFAMGMGVLAITLWSTGHLSGYRPGIAIAATATPPPPPVAIPAPDRAPAPDSASPRLAIPLANIDPARLESTFHQARNGHEHEALDIMSPRGTPVMAVDDGDVMKTFTSKPGGLTVYQFDNTGTWCYYYAHLDHYAPSLREGVRLRKGEVLGYVGSTGDASPDAPHLHFAIFRLGVEKHWWQGTAVDPLPFFK